MSGEILPRNKDFEVKELREEILKLQEQVKALQELNAELEERGYVEA